ncbi:hypothetical protein G6F65_019511 [Rhizopus arrhizus]|nr:hypothetical protein G6F65_019511 [Rhizopus arrhizus]
MPSWPIRPAIPPRWPRTPVVHRPDLFQDGRRQGNRRGELPRLVRFQRAAAHAAFPPHPGPAARTPARRAGTAPGAGSRTGSAIAAPVRGAHRQLPEAGQRPVRAGRHAARPLVGRSVPLDLAREAADGV